MSGSMFTIRVLGAAATLILVAGCTTTNTNSVGSYGSATSRAQTSATTSASGGAVGVTTTSLGPVLVDSKGFTVYMLTADTPGHSTCSAQCLQYWPLVPAPTSSNMSPVQGVSAALATTKATSGALMLTAGGWPLYTFVKDMAPGQVAGEGVNTFGGTWYAVSPSGAPVVAAAQSAPATTTSSGAYGRTGY
jgi:predicted lipoprotein with Yx(FWY)xxD motif